MGNQCCVAGRPSKSPDTYGGPQQEHTNVARAQQDHTNVDVVARASSEKHKCSPRPDEEADTGDSSEHGAGESIDVTTRRRSVKNKIQNGTLTEDCSRRR